LFVVVVSFVVPTLQMESPLERNLTTSVNLARRDFEHRRDLKSSIFQVHPTPNQSLPNLHQLNHDNIPLNPTKYSSPTQLPATSPLRHSAMKARQKQKQQQSFLPETDQSNELSSSRTKEPPPTWIVHQVAQLEAHVRKLRKENKEWTARFRDEARSRATVMDMQRIIEELKHDRREVEQALAAAEGHVEEANLRYRKAINEAKQWKSIADEKTLSELEASQIEDMLWKPKFDSVSSLHTALTDDHDKLRNAFENLFEDYLDLTSKAQRKFRPKISKSELDATAEKFAGKKKGNKTRRPPPKKKKNEGKLKKKGKFGPELVKAAAVERRIEFIKARRKKMSVHVADIVYDHSHASEMERTPDWAKNDHDHLVQVLSCPSTQNSIVPHPWAKYKPGKAPDNIRVAYVDYDRLIDLLIIVYKAALSQRFGSDIDPSESGIDEVGTFTGRMRLLTDVFREQLTLKYGQKSVVEGYLYGVAESIVRYAPDNMHIEFFGRMVGVIDPDLYSPRMGAMFMRLLRTVVSEQEAVTLLTGIEEVEENGDSNTEKKKKKNTKTGKKKELSEEAAEKAMEASAAAAVSKSFDEEKSLVTIPLARALQAVETIFPNKPDYMLAWAKKELYPDLKEKLIKTLKRLSVPSDKSMVLDVNLLLVCAVDVWLEQHETDLYALCKLFRERRINENKPLDYRVFASAVRSCTKDTMPKIPDSVLFPIFNQVLSTKDTHMDVCSRDGFAVVCCAWGIVPFYKEVIVPGEVDKKKKKK
jgi:hypothetical protein